MKKVDFNKLQAGDLVEVPRTQFAPMRRGWNGWLFSEAVVIRKGVGRKSKKNVVVVICRCRFTTPFTYKKGKGRKYDKEKARFFTGFRYCNHGRAYRRRYQGKCSGTGRNAYTD